MKTDWQTKKLGEICDFQRGLTYSKKDEVDFSDNIVLRANNIDLKTHQLDLNELKYINTKVKVDGDKKVKKGSMIMCTASGSKSHLGKVAMIDGNYNYAFGGFMAQLTPKKEIDSKYFFYELTSDVFNKHLERISSGANINNLKFSDIRDFEIQLPPLSEQKRIAKTLDDVFEKVTKAKEAAEKNLQNSKELFESYLNSVFANPGKDWEEKALIDVCEKITQGPNPKYDKKPDEKYRVLKTKNLYDDAIYYEEADQISREVFDSCIKSELNNGDVLLAIVGQGSINKCNVFENKTKNRFIYTRALGLIRTNRQLLDPYFLKAFFQSKLGKSIIDSGIGGTSGQQVVTTTHIKAINIPLPKISEQKIITKKLDALSLEIKKLEKIYEQKLADLEELKKSVLSKAFHGEL